MTVLDSMVDQPAPRVPLLLRWRGRLGSVAALALVIVAAVAARGWLVDRLASPRALATTTVFVSLLLQALPFLVAGILLSRALTTFLPTRVLNTVLRNDLAAAVVTSPAVSPVVLTCTFVAFPGHPAMVLARLLAGVVAAVGASLLWRPVIHTAPPRPILGPRGLTGYIETCRADLVRAGGFLVGGAVVVAVLAVAAPPRWLDTLAAYPAVAVTAAALFAVLLSQRAENDAVLMAALGQFSLTSRLVVLVVGPLVTLRRFSRLNAGPGAQPALIYSVGLLVLATAVATVAGLVLL